MRITLSSATTKFLCGAAAGCALLAQLPSGAEAEGWRPSRTKVLTRGSSRSTGEQTTLTPDAGVTQAPPAGGVAGQSEVTPHLQALYATHGLPMPDMRLEALPGTQLATGNVTAPAEPAVVQADGQNPGVVAAHKAISQASDVEASFEEAGSPYTGLTLDEPAAITTAAAEAEEPSLSHEDERVRRIAQRRGLAGFKGFCPVALRDDRQLKDAQAEHTASFEGVRFEFASREARELFEAHPEQYAPAARGCDVVVQQRQGIPLPGVLDHAVWYQDRLYLFHSEQTKVLFCLDPEQFAGR